MKTNKRMPFVAVVLLVAATLLACDLSSVLGPATPVVVVVTATPVPPTQTPWVIVVTATPAPGVSATLTPVAPSVTITSTPVPTQTAGAVTPSPVSVTATRTVTPSPVSVTATRTVTVPVTATATRTVTVTVPATVTVAVAPSATVTQVVGTFGAITYAPGVMGAVPNVKPVDAATRYPEGVTKVYAVFSHDGTIKGNQWRYERYHDGTLQSSLVGTGWDLTGSGTTWLNLWNADGIQPTGEWELRLYVMDRLVQKGAFTIEKRQATAPFFGAIRFAEDIKDDQPVNVHKPTENFKAGTKQIYAFFDAGNMSKGLGWKREWYRDGNLQTRLAGTGTWNSGQTEKDWWIKISSDEGLESGTYEVKLYVEDKLVQLGTLVIEK